MEARNVELYTKKALILGGGLQTNQHIIVHPLSINEALTTILPGEVEIPK
jgi:hypothetical protein